MSFPAATFSHIPQLIAGCNTAPGPTAKTHGSDQTSSDHLIAGHGSDGFIASFCWVSTFSHHPWVAVDGL